MDIGYTGSFFGGILTLLSPCSVMLLPAFFAYAFSSPLQLLSRTAMFYIGLLVTLVPLGLLSGILGSMLTQHRTALIMVAALMVMIIGVIQVIGIDTPWLRRGTGGEGTSALSVFILGSVYGIAGVCTGPILGSVLTVAAAGANPTYGGIMLALFALGMALPLVALSLVWNKFKLGTRSWMKPRRFRIGLWENSIWMIVSGVLSIGIGVLLLLTRGTGSLGGVLTIDAQYATESWVLQKSLGISNLWFGLTALVLLLVAAGIYALRISWLRKQEAP